MSAYVRVETAFYSHRKTLRLKATLGNDAFWIPPRLWAYAAVNQQDGCFQDYSAAEIASVLDYDGDPARMLEALLKAGFLDENPLRIHDWRDYNEIFVTFSNRAKLAARARWGNQIKANLSKAKPSIACRQPSIASSIASSIEHYHSDSRAVLHILNESTGRHFRENDSNLTFISARLREPDVSLDGVRLMILRQCQRWKGTEQAEYLRPETLFNKTKFDGYYAAKDLPVEKTNGNHSHQRVNQRLNGVSQNNAINNYAEAAKRKLERQALEAQNGAAQQTSGT